MSNSRIKRRDAYYSSQNEKYGELETSIKVEPRKGHCSYMNRSEKESKRNATLKAIITMGASLGAGGKHIGSKPLKTIKNHISKISKRVGLYNKALEAMRAAQEKLKAEEQAAQEVVAE